MSGFRGRVAVVTGAGSGIGRALGLALARRGARLALSDVDEDGLGETGREAEKLGAETFCQRVDVTDRAAVVAFSETVASRFGSVNQIYNNAGIALGRPIVESSFEDYDRVLAVNLWGVIHGTKAFLPHLITSGEGHVVNISSLNGFMAMAELSHYCTSKYAVRGFTETLRIEMRAARHPVKVTCVHPGGVRTAIADRAIIHERAAGRGLSAAAEEQRRRQAALVLRMSPDVAASTILTGVERNRGRVLVGRDAKFVDAAVRFFPAGYTSALGTVGRLGRRAQG
ncbi:MAG: SDR family NAD(P)-dependent oxidoreductase [Frankia sp.]